jgi:two-component system sensor histidine kinase BaeS
VFRSLRFRLPALFLVGVVTSGVVAAAIAFQLLQSYTLNRARADLRREASGLTRVFVAQASGSNDPVPAPQLEQATGDRIYYVPPAPGFDLFPAGHYRLRILPRALVDFKALVAGRTVQFELKPPGSKKTWLAVAAPLNLGKGKEKVFAGAIVVVKPKDQLQTRVAPLIGRLGLALLGGLVVAVFLAVYLSRRLTRPVLELSRVADEVALGNYDVDVPDVPGGTEVGHLANRFREMARRLAEAEQLERNFLMSVSHELRTPLTAIRGHVAALSEGLVEDAEARAFSLETITAETERLSRLVNDVLDLAKLDARRFTVHTEEVDMETLVTRAYSTFNEEARRREIDYRNELHARPVIISDGDRVLQIITNLLSNAFRWTPDGGTIALGLTAANGAVSVSVTDTGPGIAIEEQERIFRPFWSRDGGGTGLGLAIASELAQALGGRIELDTKLGKGSRFELVLPNQS